MKHIKIIDDTFDQSIYNEKAHHPLQSWQWGEARKRMGIEVLRIGEFDTSIKIHPDDTLMTPLAKNENPPLRNVYQITFHKIPYTPYKIGYLPRSVIPSKEVLTFLHDYGKKNRVIFIKVEPYEKESNNLEIGNWKLEIKNSPHPLFPKWTVMLDLSKPEDELLRSMRPKTRYNIKLAKKKGVYVKDESNEKGFEIFTKLYFETCKRQKYFGHNYEYHKMVWHCLKDKIAHILIAYYQNIPLAAYELFHFHKTLYYPYGGSSIQQRNLMATNLLMWEAIHFGKKLGAETFDMWGALPPTYEPNHPWAGFTRFKEGYGGSFVEMTGSYDLVINPAIYKMYNLLHHLRNIYLKLR